MRCYVLTPAPETTQSGTEATASQQHYYLSVSLEPVPRTMRGPRDNPCPRPPAVAPAPRVPFPEPLEAALCEPDPFLPRQIPLWPLPQLPARRDSAIDGLEARSPSFTTTPAPIATARNGPCPSNRGNPRQIRPANLINLPPPSRPPSRPPPQVPPPRIPSNPDLLHVGSAFVPANAIAAQHHQHHQQQHHNQQHHHHHRRQSTQQQRPQPQRLHIAAICPRCDGTGTTARRGSTTRAPVPPPISPTATVITRPPPNCTCSSFPAPFPFPAPPTPNGTAAAARAYNNNSITSPTTINPTTARAPTTTTTTTTRHPHTNGTRTGRHVLPNGVTNNDMTNGTILSPTTTTSMRTGPPPRPPHRRGAFSFSSGEGVRAAARAAALGLPFPYGALDGVANGLGGNGDSTGRSVGYGIDPVGGVGDQGPVRRATVAHVVAPRGPAAAPEIEAEAYEPDSEDEEAVDLVEIVDLVSSSSQPVSAFDFDSDSDEDSSDESDEDEDDDEDDGEKSDDGELDDDNKSDSSSDSEFEFDMSGGEEDGLVEMKVVLI